MKTILKLTKEQLELLQNHGNIITDGEKTYMFLPAWVEYDSYTKEYTIHYLGELPERLTKLIKGFREERTGIKKECKCK